jgi:DNA repair protein RadC
MAGESLLAVYDDASQEEVVGCGACSHTANPGQPAVLRFEKAKRNPVGGYSFEQGTDVELSPELQALFSQGGACQGGACLPWVRVQRDPQRFRAALHAARNMGPVTSSRQFYNLIKEYMVSEDQEVFVVVLLDVHANVRGIGEISRGARDRVLTPVPDVLRLPLVDGATQFVVAHNHPSGKTTPSDADKEVTKAIKKGADAVGLLFIDHIIVGANGYYSFHDHRLV